MIKLHDVPRDAFMTSVFLCASCYLTIYILLLYASSVWMTRCTNYRSFLPRFEMDPAFDLKPVPSTAFSELNAAGCFSLVSIWKDWATSLGSKHKSEETRPGLFKVQPYLPLDCFDVTRTIDAFDSFWLVGHSRTPGLLRATCGGSTAFAVDDHTSAGGTEGRVAKGGWGRLRTAEDGWGMRADGIRWCRRQLHGQNGQPTVKRLGSKREGEVAISRDWIPVPEQVVIWWLWFDMIFALALSKCMSQ